MFSDDNAVDDNGLTDTECIERCKDTFWEPTIFNLGQSYRKMKRYGEAIACFEKCSSLNPVSYWNEIYVNSEFILQPLLTSPNY